MGLSRSQQMSRIRGLDTKPEIRLRKALWARGVRYRVNWKTPAGRADVALPGKRIAIFVDGCFWHGCPDHYVRPRSRDVFWARKLRANVDRDRRQTRLLEVDGWTVLRFWEHELYERLESVVEEVTAVVAGRRPRHGRRWCVVRVDAVDETGDVERRVMEDLRSSDVTRVVEQARTTRKWAGR